MKYEPSIIKLNKPADKRFFHLVNDEDKSDVIPLYRSLDDVLAFNVHYIKSISYCGYEACKGEDCPHCKSGIRTQIKLFIPLYNIAEDQVQFWDRAKLFYPRICDMFNQGKDITNFVYRIVRHGCPGDIQTFYDISPIAKNSVLSYDEILDKFGIKFPEVYSTIIRGLDFTEYPEDIDKGKKLTPLVCAKCGAPLDIENKCCNFCGVHYIW